MKTDLELLASRLAADDAEQLKAIYEPVVVGVPAADSRTSLCVMPDGELRCYGEIENGPTGKKRVCLISADCGLSWKKKYMDPDAMGSAARLPGSGRYVTVIHREDGVYALLSDVGPGDPNPKTVRICDASYNDMFQPVMLKQRRRLLCTMHHMVLTDTDYQFNPVVISSDDDGESWTVHQLPSVPRFEVCYPHAGKRWNNNGGEPYLTEMPDGRLMLIARTSQDYFYVYYSDDAGDTWTGGEPSVFHGTLTTPFFLPMSDGRTVFFWNNNRPLPELDKSLLVPPQGRDIFDGRWEDVFTNRDISHAAVSRDCRTWTGFRELYLNSIRNESDFRSRGGLESSNDRSVHQFQAMELPFGKVLVSVGQNEVCRRLLIFDPDWLEETGRSENFRRGLQAVSTFLYVNSFSGSCCSGHCAWNRTNGALLVPSPDGAWEEALQICRVPDPRLFSDRQGVVWNFPAMKRGSVSVELTVIDAGLRVCLCDHWMNPCDVYAPLYAAFTLELDRPRIGGGRQTIRVEFDTEAGRASVFRGDSVLFAVKMTNPAPTGLSYLHLQTLAEGADPTGSYVHSLRAER